MVDTFDILHLCIRTMPDEGKGGQDCKQVSQGETVGVLQSPCRRIRLTERSDLAETGIRFQTRFDFRETDLFVIEGGALVFQDGKEQRFISLLISMEQGDDAQKGI